MNNDRIHPARDGTQNKVEYQAGQTILIWHTDKLGIRQTEGKSMVA